MQTDSAYEHEELLASGRVLTRRLESLHHASKSRAASVEFQQTIEIAMAALVRGVGLLGAEMGISPDDTSGGSAVIAKRMVNAVSGVGAAVEAPVDSDSDSAEAMAEAHLTGTTEIIGISDLLELLGSLQKTGELVVVTDRESITIELRDGKLIHAMTCSPPEGGRLGDILVHLGYVSQVHLEAFARGFAGTGRKLGEVLESGSLVSAEQLTTALADQIQQLFVRLFNAPSARFDFTAREVSGGGHQKVELGLRQLLFESARITDENGYR